MIQIRIQLPTNYPKKADGSAMRVGIIRRIRKNVQSTEGCVMNSSMPVLQQAWDISAAAEAV